MKKQMIRTMVVSICAGLVCFGCATQKTAEVETPMSAVAQPAFESMTYLAPWAEMEKVTLENGRYRKPLLAGAASAREVRLSEWQAVTRIDGQPTGAVIMVTSAGGSGTFYHLALMVQTQKEWVNSDLVKLGDRIKVHGLTFEDEAILVTMTTQGPQDPMCCPTMEIAKHFMITDGKLVEKNESISPDALAQLVGLPWTWVGTQNANGDRLTPLHPESYTVQFSAEGNVNIKADCNRKGGSYSGAKRMIAIEITHSTMAMCAEESLEQKFVDNLLNGIGWLVKGEDLYLDLNLDSGTMHFTR